MEEKEKNVSQVRTGLIKKLPAFGLVAGSVLICTLSYALSGVSSKGGEILTPTGDTEAVREQTKEQSEDRSGQQEQPDENPSYAQAPAVAVFVCGAVVNADVYELADGSRVKDAVDAAGGFREDADTDFWNLAQTVKDGQRIYVPTKEETALSGQDIWTEISSEKDSAETQTGSDSGTEKTDSDTRIDLNTATKEELMTLPGIGEAKASAILVYREEHGGFRTLEELMEVSGIKEASYSKIKEYLILRE